MGKGDEKWRELRLQKHKQLLAELDGRIGKINIRMSEETDPRRKAGLYEERGDLYEQIGRLSHGKGDVKGYLSCLDLARDDFSGAFYGYAGLNDTKKTKSLREKVEHIEKERMEFVSLATAERPKAEPVFSEIQRLEARLKQIENTGVSNDAELTRRMKTKLSLNATLGDDYKKLADDDQDRQLFVKSISHYADAANEAFKLGQGKEARHLYMEAARLSKKLGDESSLKYFVQRAKQEHGRVRKKSLDEKISTVFLFVLFGAMLAFMSPRLTGNVIGLSFGFIDYSALVFFVLFVVALALKVYSKS